MSAKIIDGKSIAKKLRSEMTTEVALLKEQGLTPHLTVILVGNHPASLSYVKGKEKAATEIGISSEIIRLPEHISEEELLQTIKKLNKDQSVHGILVQLPLPNHILEQRIIEAIDPAKDVDGFHPINIGRMMTNQDTLLPCTPYGILMMLRAEKIDPAGKHVVIVGRSNIVGKPVGQLLLNEDATVTYCHSKTNNLSKITSQADILIVATGVPNMIHDEHLQDQAIVIDVGINRLEDGTLTGDVDFTRSKTKASYITPVPGGVGPMTIAMLMHNTIKAAKGLASYDE